MSANQPRQPATKRFNINDAGVTIPPDAAHSISNNINMSQTQPPQPHHSLPTANMPIQSNQPIHSNQPVTGNVVLMYNNNTNNNTSNSPNNSANNHKPQVHSMKRLVQQQQQMQQMQQIGQPPNTQLSSQKSNQKIITARPNTPPVNYNVGQMQIQQQQPQQILPMHHLQQQQLLQQQIYCPPTQIQAMHSPGRNYLPNGTNPQNNGQILMTQQQIQYQIQQQQMIQQQQQQIQQIQQHQQYQQQQQQLQQIQHPIGNNNTINSSIGDTQIISHNPTSKSSSKSSRSSKPDLNNPNLIHQNAASNILNSTDTSIHSLSSKSKTKNQSNSDLKNADSSNLQNSTNSNNNENASSNALIRDPPPVNAAIYPVLPGKMEVQLLLKEVDFELKETKQRLNELYKLKQQNLLKEVDFETLDPSLMVQSHLGMIISHLDVNRVTNENKRVTTKMHNKYRVTNPKIEHKIMHHSHLGYLQKNIDTNTENLEHMFNATYNWKKCAEDKGRKLALQYSEMRQTWENASKALNEYHSQERASLNEWPPEMIPLLPKPKDNAYLLQFTAPDQPMYLDDIEFYSYAFYTMNAYVPDPVRAHKEYKQRLTWTSDEKQIFLDKYRLHPREFKKIAAGLPHKCVKDVIEYYYCHRIDLNLKEIEQQSKKRGRKKVITEGSVRK